MKTSIALLIAALMVPFASTAFAKDSVSPLDCTAHYDYLEPNHVVQKQISMPLTYQQGTAVKYGVDFEGHYFGVTGDLSDGTYLLLISEAPDYTSGISASASFGARNRIRLSNVNKYTVYTVECYLR